MSADVVATEKEPHNHSQPCPNVGRPMRSLEPHRAGARAETERKAIAEAQKIVAIWNARQAGGRALWFRGTLTLGGQLGTDRGIASGGGLSSSRKSSRIGGHGQRPAESHCQVGDGMCLGYSASPLAGRNPSQVTSGRLGTAGALADHVVGVSYRHCLPVRLSLGGCSFRHQAPKTGRPIITRGLWS